MGHNISLYLPIEHFCPQRWIFDWIKRPQCDLNIVSILYIFHHKQFFIGFLRRTSLRHKRDEALYCTKGSPYYTSPQQLLWPSRAIGNIVIPSSKRVNGQTVKMSLLNFSWDTATCTTDPPPSTVLLGDGGYCPCLENPISLITPYKNPVAQHELLQK